jgi:hypothetical protein
MKISSQASLPEVANVSNGDSDSNQEQQTVGWDSGTKFTVDLREIELTAEERADISSAIIDVILERTRIEAEVIDGSWRKYSKYIS